jgi:chromosome partitioning protein
MRLAVVSTKGGTGKTTTAVALAAGLHARGRTLLADLDPQHSALAWSQQGAGLPFSVISLPVTDAHRRLADLGQGYDHVIADGPPGDLAIIRSAILAADIAIVPVSPTGLDLARLAPTFDLIADAAAVRPVATGVLLTKVRARTISARDARQVLAELGYPVLDTEIPLSEAMAGLFGTMPADIGAYASLITELEES